MLKHNFLKQNLSFSSKGFTLIEILVAMTIVVVLLSISLFSFQGARKSARDSKRKSDLEQVRSALEIYRSDCGVYPATITFGGVLSGLEADCLGNDYLSEIPNDPLEDYSYQYRRLSVNSYNVCSFLETGGSVSYDSDCGGNCGSHCYYKQSNP